MDNQTLKALNGSIEKWKHIAAGDGADHGSEDCPLCQLFNNDATEVCVGCPVFERTKQETCWGTPYDNWRKETNRPHPLAGREATTARAKEIALDEVRFLESLLPRAENPSVGGKNAEVEG